MVTRPALAWLGAALLCSASPRAQAPNAWPDTPVARLEALAMIQTLNADLLASRSATLTLERWCRDHHLADEPTVRARPMVNVQKIATAEQRQRLGINDAEPIRFRHVQLRCGERVLSEADNWYVPGRLTSEMNRLLDTTDTPFGRVIQPLAPYRETLAVKMLWAPLPDDWFLHALPPAAPDGATLAIADALFEHRALVFTSGRVAFSEVDEVYQRGVLGLAR